MENKENTLPLFFNGQQYFCPLELTLDVIGGKWKTMMIYRLKDGTNSAGRATESRKRNFCFRVGPVRDRLGLLH